MKYWIKLHYYIINFYIIILLHYYYIANFVFFCLFVCLFVHMNSSVSNEKSLYRDRYGGWRGMKNEGSTNERTFSISKMAAKSGGHDEWLSVMKPILATSPRSFNKNDVIDLVKSIVKR